MPDCPKCGHAIGQTIREVPRTEWLSSIPAYFTRERGFTASAAKRAISSLNPTNTQRAELLRLARETLDALGGDAIGALGEAHASYIFEADQALVLVHAGWKEHPFAIVKGVDLIGVHLNDWTIRYIEVKTSQTDEVGIRTLTLARLGEQLKLLRLEEGFRLSAGIGAPASVAHALHRRIRTTGRGLSSKTIRSLLKMDRYARIGAVVVGTREPWDPIVAACPCDVTANRPCDLVLLVVERLPESIENLAAVETAALGG